MKTLIDLFDLSGKAAIVTGGAKGIGYGISYRLAEAEAAVLIADTDDAAANEAVQKLTDKGWNAAAIKIDVSSEAEVKKMISACIEHFGRLDILVNNAGIYPPKPIADMSVEDFDRVLDVNLRSTFMATKYAAEVMKTSGGGKIINVSSIDALHPSMVGLAHYDASKHGMWGFTKNSALEFAKDKIWINAIAPGGIQTPGVEAMQGGDQKSADEARQATLVETFLNKIPMHRMGESDEIGKVALFLASDLSSYMTGEQIVVDGGALLS